jgi:hypothetical protein
MPMRAGAKTMDVLLAFLGWCFGAVFTVIFALWLESQRRPNITISIAETREFPGGFVGSTDKKWRSLRVSVFNDPSSWVSWLMPRAPAQMCRAQISVLREDGTALHDKALVGRWTDTPEPYVVWMGEEKQKFPVLLNQQELRSALDIASGESELLDVAIRVEDDEKAYIWNNQTYFAPDWRNKDAELDHKVYLLEVAVTSSGRAVKKRFRVNNDANFSAFRLTNAEP